MTVEYDPPECPASFAICLKILFEIGLVTSSPFFLKSSNSRSFAINSSASSPCSLTPSIAC